MAGHARYTALLDACVLYPLAMTDALMSLATAGFFAAKWTTRIEEEWIRSLEKQRPGLVGKLGIRRDSMRDAIPDWEVPETAWSAITGAFEHSTGNFCIAVGRVGDMPTHAGLAGDVGQAGVQLCVD